jgi:hypothetical protein
MQKTEFTMLVGRGVFLSNENLLQKCLLSGREQKETAASSKGDKRFACGKKQFFRN